MAGDGVANHGFEFVEGIGFGENGKAEGASLEAAFGRFFDGEDDFGWRHVWAIFNDYTPKIGGTSRLSPVFRFFPVFPVFKRLRKHCDEGDLNPQP